MNSKNLLQWTDVKSQIHADKERPYFHIREVWFCSLGTNIGFEQDGDGDTYLRPVVVVKKFNNQFQYSKSQSSTAILSQIRLIDGKRFSYKSGMVSKKDFDGLKQKLMQLIA
ncbi:hypothetical protein COB55_00725 [Candidatus Wolfebacteria bacterium]|nr:MAG: hypothetical protein COB55_00725 [Candidatus Wolfebacteria bacterium]